MVIPDPDHPYRVVVIQDHLNEDHVWGGPLIIQTHLMVFLVASSGGWGFLVEQSLPDILFGCALKKEQSVRVVSLHYTPVGLQT